MRKGSDVSDLLLLWAKFFNLRWREAILKLTTITIIFSTDEYLLFACKECRVGAGLENNQIRSDGPKGLKTGSKRVETYFAQNVVSLQKCD